MNAAREQIEGMAALYGEGATEQKLETLRVPPQSQEGEQAVLGGLLLAPAKLSEIVDWLEEADFYRRDHRMIYAGILALADKGQPFDAVTLGEWLAATHPDAVSPGYLVDLAMRTPSAANLTAWAEIVVEASRKRRLIEAGTAMVNAAFERVTRSAEIVGSVQHDLATIAPVRHTGLQESKPGLMRWWQETQERVDRPGLIGIPTPWAELNRATHGLRPGRLYVLAGRPGAGKSIAGCNLASFASLRGVRTALFSLEMSAEEVHQRNTSALGEVPHDFLEAPTSGSEYWARLTPTIRDLRAAPLLVDDSPALTAAQICARAERAHLQSGLGLVLVDHLHELSVDPKDRVNAIGDAARKLKALAKRLNVPVVALAQLNRDSARGGQRPTLTDLRASGSIEEVADAVLLLHREEYYRADTHLKGVVELQIAKGRNMRSGLTIHLRAELDYMRFRDWEGPLPEAPQPADEPNRTRGFDRKRHAGGDQ